MAEQKPLRCSNKWANTAQHWLLQLGAGDLTLPLVLNEHDGTINSKAMNAIVENLNAAAAANLENCHKMPSIRLLVAMRAASTAAAETSTGDFGLAETVVFVPFRRAAASIAPLLPRRAIRDGRRQYAIATARIMPRTCTWTCT